MVKALTNPISVIRQPGELTEVVSQTLTSTVNASARSLERRESENFHVWCKSERVTKQLIQFPKLNAAQITKQRHRQRSGRDPNRSSSQRLVESFAPRVEPVFTGCWHH